MVKGSVAQLRSKFLNADTGQIFGAPTQPGTRSEFHITKSNKPIPVSNSLALNSSAPTESDLRLKYRSQSNRLTNPEFHTSASKTVISPRDNFGVKSQLPSRAPERQPTSDPVRSTPYNPTDVNVDEDSQQKFTSSITISMSTDASKYSHITSITELNLKVCHTASVISRLHDALIPY